MFATMVWLYVCIPVCSYARVYVMCMCRRARAQLTKLGLPGAVDAADSKAGVPDATWSKVYTVQVRVSVISSLFTISSMSTSPRVDLLGFLGVLWFA